MQYEMRTVTVHFATSNVFYNTMGCKAYQITFLCNFDFGEYNMGTVMRILGKNKKQYFGSLK